MKVSYTALNVIIQTVLQVIAALVDHPRVREGKNFILVNEITNELYRLSKEANITAVHILSLHHVLICPINFCKKNNTKQTNTLDLST
jgi:hypothetical protein